jgi:predicted Zn-dependent protease
MRRGELDRAEELFSELSTILPQHVPARGHRAEVALARGQLESALALITPLVRISDDPAYRATLAAILAALGDKPGAARQAKRATADYDALLARRPEAYADDAAAFFLGIGNRPLLALALAAKNWTQRDTPRSRSLLALAQKCATPVRQVA